MVPPSRRSRSRARQAFEDIEFSPSILRGMADVGTSSTVLGGPGWHPVHFLDTGNHLDRGCESGQPARTQLVPALRDARPRDLLRAHPSSSTQSSPGPGDIRHALGLSACLGRVQLRVAAARREQLVMVPDLDDASVLHDHYTVGVANGREPVRHDQRGAPGTERAQG
jgi:hypothetical protein